MRSAVRLSAFALEVLAASSGFLGLIMTLSLHPELRLIAVELVLLGGGGWLALRDLSRF